jgi:hypothetical protein
MGAAAGRAVKPLYLHDANVSFYRRGLAQLKGSDIFWPHESDGHGQIGQHDLVRKLFDALCLRSLQERLIEVKRR